MRHVFAAALCAAAVAGAAATFLNLTSEAEAQSGPRYRKGGGQMVHVCSRYGRGCVSGAVRQGRVELEVRLPGGNWIGCRQDCSNTLREETVDFFETLRERAPSWR